MPYDKHSMSLAKKKGLFNDKVFDPNVLQLSEEEKKKLQRGIKRHSHEENKKYETTEKISPRSSQLNEKKDLQIELNFFEIIYLSFIAVFSKNVSENYKLNKALKTIERNLSKYKPSVYNISTKRVTRYFAYKLHDLYLKIVFLKKIIDHTINDANTWCNPDQFKKTGLEFFFEKMMNINLNEVDSNFSYQGISRIMADFEGGKKAENAVENSIKAYLSSFEISSIQDTNKKYTNLMYIKDLVEYKFINLFKRFDREYDALSRPAFEDISSEALLPYLSELEDILLKIDLSLDNVKIFMDLLDVSVFMKFISEEPQMIEEGNRRNQEVFLSKERFVNESNLFFDDLKDIMDKNYFTQLIQIVKKDPFYSPSLIRTNYDILKLYCNTFEKRMNYIAQFILNEKRAKKIEVYIKKLFPVFNWAGIYTSDISNKIEDFGISGFYYHYHLGIINTFLDSIYDQSIKSMLNLTVSSGLFTDNYFQKTVSETFYSIEKFKENLLDFILEMNDYGAVGKKITTLLYQMNGKPIETKKMLERNISYANMKAGELFDRFYPNFSVMVEIITKLHNDINSKPPKYLRNIRSIGGLKNLKYLNTLSESHETIKSIQELMILLKD